MHDVRKKSVKSVPIQSTFSLPSVLAQSKIICTFADDIIYMSNFEKLKL